MVYTQICEWLDDFIGDEPPCELIDVWDLTEWIHESEILEIFEEFVIPSFKNKRSRDDADNILHSLIWEYYLFRRAGYIGTLKADNASAERIRAAAGSAQQSLEWHKEKRDLLTASEFGCILDSRRLGILRSKIVNKLTDGELPQNVFLSRDGKLNASAWGIRYEEVVRRLYEKANGCNVLAGIPRLRHPQLGFLAASPDGLVLDGPTAGRLVEIKAPLSRDLEEDVVPQDYYCQMQIQMEVCGAQSADYCECRLGVAKDGNWSDISRNKGPSFVGSVAVVGSRDDYKTWSHKYSPLFPNNEEGRALALAWRPTIVEKPTITVPDAEDNYMYEPTPDEIVVVEILETQVWEVIDWQIITVPRNTRWWSLVGLPEYERFVSDVMSARADPLYLVPKTFEGGAFPTPMFLDD
jgi:hypothetical protein